MFEKLLESILSTYLGRFIEGFDQNNLKVGVWSGNVQIENVSLKQQAVQMLDLPFRIKASTIGKLTLKVPWKKLSSLPVEIYINQVFIVLEPISANQWAISDSQLIEQKLQILLEHCKECISKAAQSTKEEQTYFDKLGKRILDNIQLTVSNIHIRWESNVPVRHSWGLTLQAITIDSTDENWKKAFVDRTEVASNLYRLFQLKNLGVYWNSNETQQYVAGPLNEFMAPRINSAQLSSFVININGMLKLKQSLEANEFQMQLGQLDARLSKTQFQQLIHLLESFSLYQTYLWTQRRRRVQVPTEQQLPFQPIFTTGFKLILQSESQQIHELAQNDIDPFRTALHLVELDLLTQWTRAIAKAKSKEARIVAAQKQSANWWKSLVSKNKEELSPKEIKEIEEEIDTLFAASAKAEPSNLITIFDFSLDGGGVEIEFLVDERLQVKFMRTHFNIQAKPDNLVVEFQQHSLDAMMGCGHLSTQIIRQIEPTTPLMQFTFTKRTLKNQSEANLDMAVMPLECIYNLQLVRRITEFIDPSEIDESLKTLAWTKVDTMRENTQQTVGELVEGIVTLRVKLDVQSPVLVVPFANSDECWVAHLGDLRMDTVTDEQESYTFELKDTSLQYFKSIEHYRICGTSGFGVLQCAGTQLKLIKSKPSYEAVCYRLEGEVPPVEIQLNQYLSHQALAIEKLIVPQHSELEDLEHMQHGKQEILTKQCIAGHILRKVNKKNSWSQFYAILSGPYIYFYLMHDDAHFESYYYIKSASISKLSSNQLRICSKFAQPLVLQFDQMKQMDLWFDKLEQQVAAYRPPQLLIIAEAQSPVRPPAQSRFDCQLKLAQVHVSILDAKQLPCIDLNLNRIGFSFFSDDHHQVADLTLHHMRVADQLYKYKNPAYQHFMLSSQSDVNPFVSLRYSSVKLLDDNLDNWRIDIDVVIDHLNLNWKPDLILLLQEMCQRETHAVNTLKEHEIELKLKGLSDKQIRQAQLDGLVNRPDLPIKDELPQGDQMDQLLSRDDVLQNLDSWKSMISKKQLEINTKLTVKVRSTQINLMHGQTHLALGYFSITDLQLINESTPIANFTLGTVGDLGFYNSTGYPQTVRTELEQGKCDPRKVFGREGNDHENKNIVCFRNAVYERNLLNVRQNSFLSIIIGRMEAHFTKQPIVRLVNYLLIQVVYLLTCPEYLTMNDHLLQGRLPSLVTGTVHQIVASVLDPLFTSLRVQVEGATITMGLPTSATQLQLLVNSVLVVNTWSREDDRVTQGMPKLPIWCEQLVITAQHLSCRLLYGSELKQVSNMGSLTLEYTRLTHVNEILELYPAYPMQRHQLLISKLPSFILHLNHQDYQQICLALMYSINNDDSLDSLFIHDYQVSKLFPQPELRALINLPILSLFLDSTDTFAQILIRDGQFELHVKTDRSLHLNFYSRIVELSEFVQKPDSFDQVVVVGKLGLMKSFESQEEFQRRLTESLQPEFRNEPRISYKFNGEFETGRVSIAETQARLKENKYQLVLDMTIDDHQDDILLTVCDLQLGVKTNRFMQLAEWFAVPTDEVIKSAAKERAMSLVLNLEKMLLCFPTKEQTDQILTASTDINYIFSTPSSKLSSHKLSFSNLELFTTSVDNILSNMLQKKQIILPLLLYLSIQSELENDLLIQTIDCTFDRTCIKLSNKDIQTIYSALLYQQDNQHKPQHVMPQEYQKKQSLQPAQQKFVNAKVIAYAVQLVMVTDLQIPTPLFDLFFNEIQIQQSTSEQLEQISLTTQIQSSNYNNELGIWEPLLEPLSLQIDHKYNPQLNPKSQTEVQLNGGKQKNTPLNLNLTAQIIQKFKLIGQTLTQQTQTIAHTPELSQLQLKQLMGDEIQAVSPYIITNKTGHDIDVKALLQSQQNFTAHLDPVYLSLRPNETKSICFNTGYDSLFQQQFNTADHYIVQKKFVIVQIKCNGQVVELRPIDVDNNSTKHQQVDMVVGNFLHHATIISRFERKGDYKYLTITTDTNFTNKTQLSIQLRLVSAFDKKSVELIVAPQSSVSVPMGFENATFSCHYAGNHTKPIELGSWRQSGKDLSENIRFSANNNAVLILQKTMSNHIRSFRIELLCPYAIRNNLPVMVIYKVQGSDQEIICNSFSKSFISSVNSSQPLTLSLKLPGFLWSSYQIFTPQATKNIAIDDYHGQRSKINCTYVGMIDGLVTFMLQADIIFQICLERPFYLYGRKSNQKDREKSSSLLIQQGAPNNQFEFISGQPMGALTAEEDLIYREGGRIQFANDYDELQLSFASSEIAKKGKKQGDRTLSNTVLLSGGVQSVQIPLDKGCMDVITIPTRFHSELDIEASSTSILLTLKPKCIVVNRLETEVIVLQSGSDNHTISIKAGQQQPLFWVQENQQNLYFKIIYDNKIYISGSVVGTGLFDSVILPIKNINQSAISEYITVSSKEHQYVQFLTIQNLLPNLKPLYELSNTFVDLVFEITQMVSDKLHSIQHMILLPQTDIPYALDHPTHQKQLAVQVSKATGGILGQIKLDLTQSNWIQERRIPVGNTQISIYIVSKFSPSKGTIQISFSPIKNSNRQTETDSQQLDRWMEVLVPQMNVSIISTPTPKRPIRYEIAMINLQHLHLAFQSNAFIQTAQLKLSDLGIDSNRLADGIFPVLLRQKAQEPSQKGKNSLLNLLIQRPVNEGASFTCINDLMLALQPLIVKISEGTIEDILVFVAEIQVQQQLEKSSLRLRQQLTIQVPDASQMSSNNCFIGGLCITPIKLKISLQMKESVGQELKQLTPVSLGFLNLEDASILLPGVKLSNSQQTQSELVGSIIENYRSHVIKNAYKLIGNMDILGNPLGLIRNIGVSIKDLWEVPAEGFEQGGIEGGIGIVKGVGSMTQGVVSGTFNSVQKVTGSIAEGVSAVSMDDDFDKDRQRRNKKQPTNALEGTLQGFQSLAMGITHGVGGLVSKPLQEAEKGGVGGFFKGAAMGLAGLITKPVIGVIDLTTKTAEGIKNNTSTKHQSAKPERVRMIRAFYGFNQRYKSYSNQDSELIATIHGNLSLNQTLDLQKNGLHTLLLQSYRQVKGQSLFIYVLLTDRIILIDVNQNSLKFETHYANIIEIKRPSKTTLTIKLANKQQAQMFSDSGTISIQSDDNHFLTNLYQGIQDALKGYSENRQ